MYEDLNSEATTLPSYDPWDGDPAQFDTIAAMLVKREDDVTEVRLGITSLLSDPHMAQWLGKSADAFRDTLGPVPRMLGQMAGAYAHAAGAVQSYSRALRDGKAAFAKIQSTLQAQMDPDLDGQDTAEKALAAQASGASDEHDKAKRACAKELGIADQDLRAVASQLGAASFDDFDGTFVAGGGSLADLVSGLSGMGTDLYTMQVDAVRSALAGDKGAIPPDMVRTEVQDMLNAYGADPEFWTAFGPLAGKIPGYLDQYDRLPDGSLPPEDQTLLKQLGQCVAKAASAGDMTGVVANASDADLLGLSTIVAAAGGGGLFGKGSGAQFLADLVTKTTDRTTKLRGSGSSDAYDQALLQDLQAATADGDAVRLALSGPGGQQLVTQLLQGSVSMKEMYGVLAGNATTTVGPVFTDPGAISAFLNTGLMRQRGSDPVALQEIQAAMNVVRAAAAFSSWDPSTDTMAAEVGPLPDSITRALIHYAGNNSLDLALSAHNSGDSIQMMTVGPNTPFYNFVVTQSEEQSFLTLVLKDPKDAGAFRGWLQGSFTGLVKIAIQDGPKSDWTQPYSYLITDVQKIMDQQQMSSAEHADAAAANRLMVFNMVDGAFGSAPGGVKVGIGQTVNGFLQPLVGSQPSTDAGLLGRLFGQSHAADAAQATHADDISQIQSMEVLVAQGALDSGRLKPDMLYPGVVVDGKVQDNGAFQTWYESLGSKLALGPPGPKDPTDLDKALPQLRTLQQYVDEFTNALELHS